MQHKFTKLFQRHSVWLSLLLHLLFFTTYVVSLQGFLKTNSLVKREPLPSYVPSYTQSEPSENIKETRQMDEPRKEEIQPKPVDKHGIEKPVKQVKEERKPVEQAAPSKPSEVRFAKNQIPVDISDSKNTEPMHLVGETKIVKPLIKILAKALQQHLVYPKIAQDFNLQGVVLVGFRLHSQGYVTETKIVRSSGAGVLDDAARNAVNGMSPLTGVSDYIKGSEFLVVGIIFGGPAYNNHT